MLNTTLLYLTLSSLSTGPRFVPFGSLQMLKSKLSFFSSPAIYSTSNLLIGSTAFTKFLSTAIITMSDNEFRNQYIETKQYVQDQNLLVMNCLFQNCVSTSGIGGGGICSSGSLLMVNESAFLNCYTSNMKTHGGAIYSTSTNVNFSMICFSQCYCTDTGQAFLLRSSSINIEDTSIQQSGTASSYGYTMSINGFVTMQYMNASNNLVQAHGSAIYLCSRVSNAGSISYSTFYQNAGSSTVYIYLPNQYGMSIYLCNFVGNKPPNSVLYSPSSTRGQINVTSCIFRDNSNLSPSHANTIIFFSCYSDASNWGSCTTSNCFTGTTATYHYTFYDGRVCHGEKPIDPMSATTAISESEEPENSSTPIIPVTPNITNTEIPITESITTVTPTINEMIINVKDPANTVAIVFAILEGIIILIFLILFIYCCWKHHLCFLCANKSEAKEASSENQQSDTIDVSSDNIEEKHGTVVQLPPPTVPRKNGKYQKSVYYNHEENSEERTPGSKKRSQYPDHSYMSPSPPTRNQSTSSSPRNKASPRNPKGKGSKSSEVPIIIDEQHSPSPKKKPLPAAKLTKVPMDEAPLISDSSRKSAITIVFSSSDSD